MDLSYALETVLSKQFPSSPQDVLGKKEQGSLVVGQGKDVTKGVLEEGIHVGYIFQWFSQYTY
jgi:hypothetical protein